MFDPQRLLNKVLLKRKPLDNVKHKTNITNARPSDKCDNRRSLDNCGDTEHIGLKQP